MTQGQRIFVTGTGTEVGKTFCTVALMAELVERGHSVAAHKPAQSFEPADLGTTDAEQLAKASGQSPQEICPTHRWYDVALAPPMAAESTNRQPATMHDYLGEFRWTTATYAFVEGAGGLRSPIASDGDCLDLARALNPDLYIVVAHCELGVIHSVISTCEPLDPTKVVVWLNWFDETNDLHLRNRAWLGDRAPFPLVTDAAQMASRLESEIPR